MSTLAIHQASLSLKLPMELPMEFRKLKPLPCHHCGPCHISPMVFFQQPPNWFPCSYPWHQSYLWWSYQTELINHIDHSSVWCSYVFIKILTKYVSHYANFKKSAKISTDFLLLSQMWAEVLLMAPRFTLLQSYWTLHVFKHTRYSLASGSLHHSQRM